MACHIKAQFVPEIFNHPTWEDKIEVRQFSHSKFHTISVVKFDQDIWDTIVATNPANLKPFGSYRKTPTGNIEFSTVNVLDFTRKAADSIRRVNSNSYINPKAMATIHGFRDVRSAQANDKDQIDSEY